MEKTSDSMTKPWVEIHPKGVTVSPEYGKRLLVRYVINGAVHYTVVRYGVLNGKFTKHDTHWCYIDPPDGEKE